MKFSDQLWSAMTDVRYAATRQSNPLEKMRLHSLADVLAAECRVQQQRESPGPHVVEFIPTEPLRRLG